MKNLFNAKAAFLSLRALITSINDHSSFSNTDLMMKEAVKSFEEIKEKLESIPVFKEPGIMPVRNVFFFILDSQGWMPIHRGEENTQGGLIWSIDYEDETASGTSRILQWADCDAEGNPCININFEDFIKINKMYL
jgi:hypothetical protein